jgi:hypothetical protein
MTEDDLKWLREHFDRCAPWLQDALDRDIGTFDLEDVWQYVATGKAQLWPLKQSVIVTCLEYFPKKTVLRYWLCGGEKNECIESTKSIEKWAREAGATQCIIGGRRGWLRALKGYEEKFVVMTKDL